MSDNIHVNIGKMRNRLNDMSVKINTIEAELKKERVYTPRVRELVEQIKTKKTLVVEGLRDIQNSLPNARD